MSHVNCLKFLILDIESILGKKREIALVDLNNNPILNELGSPTVFDISNESYRYLLVASHIRFPEMVYSSERKMEMFFESALKEAIDSAKKTR
jgi:hypothetical protein